MCVMNYVCHECSHLATKAQASLRICAASEPSLFACTKYGRRPPAPLVHLLDFTVIFDLGPFKPGI